MFSVFDKRVKIVATLGPSSDAPEMIVELAKAGVDVFRVNFSHSSAEYARMAVGRIRAAEKAVHRPLAILGDLAGPKIRIGVVDQERNVGEGDTLVIVAGRASASGEISLNFPKILDSVKPGAEVYLGDGDIKLRVAGRERDGFAVKVLVGGFLRSNMTFAVQGITLPSFDLGSKDRVDIRTAVATGMDMVAVSFVQTGADIRAVRRLMPSKNPPFLCAKIETKSGVECAEDILAEADCLMVARGDMGFSVPLEEIPGIQKRLIDLCVQTGKPVITATQMLESMTHTHMPTRAEVTDVANAILDGTDAVMLSGETARGKFPLEAVRMMTKIGAAAAPMIAARKFPEREAEAVPDAVALSVVKTACRVGAKLIVVFTMSGATARRIARHHPEQPIVAFSPNEPAIRRLALSWGVTPCFSRELRSLDEMLAVAHSFARKNSVWPLKKGDLFVVSAGVPFGASGATNLLLVQKTG